MTACAVGDQKRVDTSSELIAELVEKGLHGAGGDDRQHQAEGDVALRADGTEQVDGSLALILAAGGSLDCPIP